MWRCRTRGRWVISICPGSLPSIHILHLPNPQQNKQQQVGVAVLATQFNLPVPVVETAIKDRLGTLLRAKLRAGGYLYLGLIIFVVLLEWCRLSKAGIDRPLTDRDPKPIPSTASTHLPPP
jgi:hypothetical protein